MKYLTISGVLLALLLSACSDKVAENPATEGNGNETAIAADSPVKAVVPDLPDNAPAVGTAIKDIVKPVTATGKAEDGTELTTIMWEDLIPADFQPESIMAKYQDKIDNTPEGSPEEKALFDIIMAEFNNAPSNDALSGKKVKMPGFVSPLDEVDGMVNEFLLVPYFGSCIHSPPPPVNQTVLVKPLKGKSISMDRIYEPVWVIGDMKVEFNNTDLAQAGYLIENARLEVYESEEEKKEEEEALTEYFSD